jgi:hypothetical protein
MSKANRKMHMKKKFGDNRVVTIDTCKPRPRGKWGNIQGRKGGRKEGIKSDHIVPKSQKTLILILTAAANSDFFENYVSALHKRQCFSVLNTNKFILLRGRSAVYSDNDKIAANVHYGKL